MVEDRTINFMLDGQQGVLRAFDDIFLNSKLKFYARHIFANFKSKFPSIHIRNLFWAIAKAINSIQFNVKMEEIKQISAATY